MNNVRINPMKSKTSAVSFGTISNAAKNVINNQGVRTILEREHGITGKHLRALDTSALRFSLISEMAPELEETAGLCVTPPKGSNIPKVILTKAKRHNHQFFASIVKKACDMESAYRLAIKNFSSHRINAESTPRIARIEQNLSRGTREYVKAYNSGDATSFDEVADTYIQKAQKGVKIKKTAQARRNRANSLLAKNVESSWAQMA